MQSTLDLCFGKTSLEFSAPKITPLVASWERLPALVPPSFQHAGSDGLTLVWLMDPGAGLPGAFSTLNGSVWPNAANVCSLSQVLETGRIPRKYFLSAKACRGILRRAEKRGKTLPSLLERALRAVADSGQSSTSGGGYELSPALTASGRGVEPPGDSRGQDCVIPILEAGARTGNSTNDPRAGIGGGDPGDPMYTLQSGKQHAVFAGELSPTLCGSGNRTGGDRPPGTQVETAESLIVASTGDVYGHDNALVAFSCKDSGADASEISPTLRAMEFDGSHANGGGKVAVALAIRGRDGTPQIEMGGEISNAILTPNGGRGGIGVGAVMRGMAVRRLTPMECERLQGFPDRYTAIDFRGKPAADGPRYKALGNSMAVPVVRWIGERIRAVLDE